MELYIGNATKQYLQFEFRLLEKGKISRTIVPGTQTCFDNLSTPQIDAIVHQHRRYGMLAVDEISGMRRKVDYIYSIGKPVKPKVIEELARHNDAVLLMRGRETRKRLAISINDNLEKNLDQQNRAENIRGFDLTVQELEPPKTGYRTDIAEPVSETIKLDLSPQSDAPQRMSRRQRRRLAS